MSDLPPNLSGGSPAPTHADFNALRKFALENALTSGAPGLRRRAFGGGSLVSPIGQRNPRRFLSPPNWFKLYDATVGATLKVGITPGLVNGISPTTGGGLLSDIPPPLATITATTHFWVKVVGTFGTPDTYVVTIETAATVTPPAADTLSGTGFTYFRYIGYATVSGGAITSIFPAPSPLPNLRIAAAGLGIFEF